MKLPPGLADVLPPDAADDLQVAKDMKRERVVLNGDIYFGSDPRVNASLDAVLGTKDEEEPTADKIALHDRAASSRGAAPALESAKGLARVVERLIASDPYYSEAVGLDEAWRDTSLRRDVFEMSDFEVANAMLYATPELALAILACEDDAKRRALTETVASGMEAAVAAGLTPRKARLFKSLGAFAVLFALGFGVACARDLVEANWPQ